MYCGFCGSNEHTIKNCPSTWGGSARRSRMHCSFCGSNEHNIKACPSTWQGNADRAWHEDKIKDDFVKDKKR